PRRDPTSPLTGAASRLLGEVGKRSVEGDDDFRPFSTCPRTACPQRMTRRARLCPPALHNEQSSCRGIASLGALSHLPEGYGRAPPLLDSRWQVALLMTSNPIIEHGERSSRISLQFRSEQS